MHTHTLNLHSRCQRQGSEVTSLHTPTEALDHNSPTARAIHDGARHHQQSLDSGCFKLDPTNYMYWHYHNGTHAHTVKHPINDTDGYLCTF